jgi:membrane protease YdiL (CAAX protease family)
MVARGADGQRLRVALGHTTAMNLRVCMVVFVVAAGCSRPVRHARMSVADPVFPEERIAAAERAARRCSTYWGLLFPGVGQLCLGRTQEGAAIASVAVADAAAASVAAVRTEGPALEHPAVSVPLLAFQETYLFAAANIAIREDLANRKLYAPQDSLADVAAAPFNLEVMKRPEIWAALVGGVAAFVGASFLIEDDLTVANAGGDANVFGKTLPFAAGGPLGLAAFAGLDLQVAVGEEALFRGVVQSGLSREVGETGGLLLGTLIFGAMHVGPAFTLEGEERRNFLRYKLPAVVAAGAYFGWLYQRSDYSLAPPTAMHFWFDFLLSGAFFVIRPEESPISFTYEARF